MVFDDKGALPSGTIVAVEPIESPRLMTPAERYKDIIDIAFDLSPDMADNHDHHVHGMPKKSTKPKVDPSRERDACNTRGFSCQSA